MNKVSQVIYPGMEAVVDGRTKRRETMSNTTAWAPSPMMASLRTADAEPQYLNDNSR